MGKTCVLTFYGHHASEPYGCFSNFFSAPFAFLVPEEFFAFEISVHERTVECEFAEKAIMVCKAAAMGDSNSYHKIRVSKAPPAAIKQMGREVQGFSEAIWREIECSVAFEVVQKFLKVAELQAKLLATEDTVIAEATANDRNWATGLDKRDERNHNPPQWQGSNMLGWALMESRKVLRSSSFAEGSPKVSGNHQAQAATAHAPEEELCVDPILDGPVASSEMHEGIQIDTSGSATLQPEERRSRWPKKR